ncbi:MAG: hypothetical protein WD851_13180 [Pirellulales bacterium]
MYVSFVGIFLLLFLLGGLVFVAALVANRRTRPFALTLVGILGIFAVVMLGALWSFRVVAHHVPAGEVIVPMERINTYPPLAVAPMPPLPPSAIENLQVLTAPQIDLDDGVLDGDEAVAAEVSLESPETPKAEGEKSDDASEAPSDEDNAESPSEAAAVEPTEEPEKTEPKPAPKAPDWINAPPSSVGGVYRQVTAAGPWSDAVDCHRGADDLAYAAVQKYLAEIASDELHVPLVSVPELARLGISKNWIRQNVVCSHPEPFIQTTQSSVGPMNTLYTQLEIDPNDQEFMRERWRDYVRRDRIAAVAAGGSFLLGGIGLLFGLLKIDTWTKGYYTKRLFLGVPAAIIGVMLLLLNWHENIF